MNPFFLRGAIAAAAALACSATLAQTSSAASLTPAEPTLKPVIVTANPLGNSDIAQPAQALTGSGLLLRQQSTLGELLSGTPGVSSSYFGPNASRPIIRGLDGDRIRILNNSGATLDASGLSYDHAVALDPIAVERIEVLRAPALCCMAARQWAVW
jgi:iron complex outermembrane recepter protein